MYKGEDSFGQLGAHPRMNTPFIFLFNGPWWRQTSISMSLAYEVTGYDRVVRQPQRAYELEG